MSDRVVVVIIDSGINLSDEEIVKNKDRFEGFYDINSKVFYNDFDSIKDSEIFADYSYHGTKIAKIVLNNSKYARILVIKLIDEIRNSITLTSSLMIGIDFAIRYSITNMIPTVVNISYGMEYGSHNGDSILEEYINSVSKLSKCIFVVGTGNEANSRKHVSVQLVKDKHYVPFYVSELSYFFNVCIYYIGFDEIDFLLESPSRYQYTINNGLTKINSELNFVSYKRKQDVYSAYNEVYIACTSKYNQINEGIWNIIIIPRSTIYGNVELWLPDNVNKTSDVYFLEANNDKTLTIPSTTKSVISVGAYNPKTYAVMPFSGRGYTLSNEVKPDVCASGVEGTSFATPIVSSMCADEMYKGIVLGEDYFMYGEKLKVKIIKKAVRIGQGKYPNNSVGWGYL